MPVISPEELKKEQTQQSTIVEVAPGRYKGPFLKGVYDNRTECLFDNIKEKDRRKQKSMGLNKFWQTPEQEEAANQRKAVAEKRKENVKRAEVMVEDNK